MKPALGSLVVLAWCTLIPWRVQADGTLPPLPYRYLHPPPALAAVNEIPRPGVRTVSASQIRSGSWFMFTGDGQAGISGKAGALALAPGTTAVTFHAQAVTTPSGLPAGLVADGNAYRIWAVETPGGKSPRIVKSVDITLSWPHIPLAIEIHAGSTWRQLCPSANAIFTSRTIACPTKTLGIFAALTLPPSTTTGTGVSKPRPVNQPAAWTRFLPFAIAIVVVIVAAIIAYLFTRPRTPAR